jgi:GNAT superfamily N-acetyltransferase
MLDAPTLVRASVAAGLDWLKPPRHALDDVQVMRDAPAAEPSRKKAWLVPMRALGPAHRGRIARHLLALSPADRYLRFGFPATDEHISRYAASLNFDRDDIYGVYNRRLELLAVAHVAFGADPQSPNCAEFGVSVLAEARGRGYGSRLFERALIHARNEGVDMLFIHALSENAPMLAIARKHGAMLERHGEETEAFLKLAPPDWESQLDEFMESAVADIDFEMKLQAKQFWAVLAAVQEIRRSLPTQE